MPGFVNDLTFGGTPYQARTHYNDGRRMASKRKLKLKCPICRQPVANTGEDFPFCSDRCRLIDLGKWASGQYVVSSPVQDTSDEADTGNFPDVSDED